ncbi:reverse transcriptase [Plakobranchus ocellatus]|uniref:Reverse transcriptase n=1 Tax=Plakobranchus ocellatus TaxID=259542 RepID=A0AAV4DJX8_9GAST|nr:reverse transcriptase [Plakobranchus ocellatus]
MGFLGNIVSQTLDSLSCNQFSDKKISREAIGTTSSGASLSNVISTITQQYAEFYLECLVLCVADDLCRAVRFQLAAKTCTVVGPSSFTGLQVDPGSTKFIRLKFTKSV